MAIQELNSTEAKAVSGGLIPVVDGLLNSLTPLLQTPLVSGLINTGIGMLSGVVKTLYSGLIVKLKRN